MKNGELELEFETGEGLETEMKIEIYAVGLFYSRSTLFRFMRNCEPLQLLKIIKHSRLI